jgi:uncharacterized Rmd1/YagE family protein
MSEPAQTSEDAAIPMRALLLGDRLNIAGLDRSDVVGRSPFAYRLGRGLVVLFRYGAIVLIGLDRATEDEVVASLADRIEDPEPRPEEETTTVIVRPEQYEQVTPSGAIQLKTVTLDHLLIIADALAKSVALAADEARVSAFMHAVEPFASSLAAKGRSPGGRRKVLRLIGQALLVDERLAGRVAVREKPDLLWDKPDLERLHIRLREEYDLLERAEIVDRSLAVVASSARALVSVEDAARSLRLEIAVVVLILAELIVLVAPAILRLH